MNGAPPTGQPGILHADLDAFFASVEQRDDPRLRGRPVLVGGGVIVAASYEAKRCGVRTPTNEREARRLCPDAVVVSPRFEAYLEASRVVFECFSAVTPAVEGISIDEAFLDIRGARRLLGSPLSIARNLRQNVRDTAGLAVSVGIASTKFLAKVASASAKPDGVLLIPLGEEHEFLHPLPIERVWGVGPATARRLHAIGVDTVGELAAVPVEVLVHCLGRATAMHLHALAWNRDHRPVRRHARRRSIGSQSALGRSRRDAVELHAAILAVADRVSRRLRRDQRLARTVTLRLRLADQARVTRSASLAHASDATHEIAGVAQRLLAAAMPLIDDRGCTLIGLALTNLVPNDAVQLTLPWPDAPGSQLDGTLDDIRSRFGNAAITRASLVDRERLRAAFGEPLYEPDESGSQRR